ncbi:hypothetical protein [Polynucleobacter necessarius]|uniref:hypothetical protein n=1 Tax=Polynucleobacter necessarius TaxID=576610 RepID=UPI000E08FF6C|nr:hypothetical protein [Polynucleobacter necessarius]
MQEDIEKIYAKLVNLETEIQNLREGYIIISERYTVAISSLKSLTASALEAAKRAAVAAKNHY